MGDVGRSGRPGACGRAVVPARERGSTNGGFLMKRDKDTGKVIKVDSVNGVTILNTIPKDYQFPKNINYQYYIGRCKKIISLLENVQLSLFDL